MHPKRTPVVVHLTRGLSLAAALWFPGPVGSETPTSPPSPVPSPVVGAPSAEPPSDWSPGAATGETIGLLEAVHVALEHSPSLRLDLETTRLQRGLLQEAKGAFDSLFTTDVSYQRIRQQVLASLSGREQEKRDTQQEAIDEVQERLDAALGTTDELERLRNDPAGFRSSDPDLQANIDLVNTLLANADPSDVPALLAFRERAIEEALAAQRRLVAEIQEDLDEEVQDLEDLGEVPDEEELSSGRLGLTLTKPLRNGQVWGLFADMTFDRNRYVGKPVDPELGGKGIEDLYRSTLGFTVDLPLLRGRGKATAGAREKAAELELEAALASARHGVAAVVFDTVRAYWEAVAAQERVSIFQGSVELQERVSDLTEVLIRADELPGAERSRVRANLAGARSRLEAARRGAREARIELARVIGLRVAADADAPRVAGAFPQPVTTEELIASKPVDWIAGAVDRRQDVAAAGARLNAGETLRIAAERDRKPRLDLGGRFWYNAVGEGSASNATDGEWVGPSYNVTLDLDWPVANNAQRGRAIQAAADAGIRAVDARDRARLVRAGAVLVYSSLTEALEQLRLAEEAVVYARESVDADLMRFGFEATTLVDTLLTEQRLTEAELGLTEARRRYALLVAQSRFETGTLVDPAAGGGSISEWALTLPPGVEPALPDGLFAEEQP